MKVAITLSVPAEGKNFTEIMEVVTQRVITFGLPTVPDLDMKVMPVLQDGGSILTWVATVKVFSTFEA